MKKILVSLVLALSLGVFGAGLFAQPAFAGNAKSEICKGAGAVGNSGGCGTGGVSIDNILKNVVQLVAILVGIAATIMIMVAGFKYATAGGEANKIASAKSTLIYALVGLVIAAMAQLIVGFVLKQTE